MKQGLVAGLAVVFLVSAAAWAALGGGDIFFSVSGAANVLFSHDEHAGKTKIGCTECHYAVFINRANHRKATMTDMQQGRSCGACHNGKRAFGVSDVKLCGRCHNR